MDATTTIFAEVMVSIVCLLIGMFIGWWIRSRQSKQEKKNYNDQLGKLNECVSVLQQKNQAIIDERDELKSSIAGHVATLNANERRIQELTNERDAARLEVNKLKDKYAALDAAHQAQNAEFEEQRKSFNEKLELLQNAEKQLTQQFENLANKIFENKTDVFKKASSEQITQLLTPFREQIDGLHKDVKEASKERHSLSKEIEKIVTEANALTHALKGDSKTQGDWGEVLLELILENTGLRKGEEYEVQNTYTSSEGERLRPDVIIHLPEERDIVIDSKVSLTAYQRFVNAEIQEERDVQLQAHVQSMRQHINQLATKRYDNIPAIRTLDYTLMWVPIEPAYFAAMQADPGIFNQAMQQRIIPVCATTLFAVLKVVERIWQYERQNTNIQEIINRTSSLYDKFVGFVEALEDVGRKLEQARNSYSTAKSRLVEGPGNVIRQIEQIREMGLSPKKRLPSSMVQQAGVLTQDGSGGEVDGS